MHVTVCDSVRCKRACLCRCAYRCEPFSFFSAFRLLLLLPAADYGERMTGSIDVVVMCMYTVSFHTHTPIAAS